MGTVICVTFISKLSPILKHFLQIARVTTNLFDLCITGYAALKPELPLYHTAPPPFFMPEYKYICIKKKEKKIIHARKKPAP